MINAVYGAGIYGRVFKEGIEELGQKVNFFIDQFSSELEIEGIPVLRISDVEDKSDVCVFISVALNNVDENGSQICLDLKAVGFVEIIEFSESLQKIPAILPNFPKHDLLWMSDKKDEMVNDVQINKLISLLSDQTSIELLKKIVRFRKTFSHTEYVTPDRQQEYFPDDIEILSKIDDLRFIDAGAYVGDTVASVVDACHQKGKKIDYIASFEPDLMNIQKLSKEVKQQQKKDKKAKFFVYTSGVWSKNDILYFSNEGNSSSNITESEEDVISIFVNSIDSVLYATKPNYIKMDVEGAELEALKGSKQTIVDFKPILAICIYHKPADLWELPLFIHSLVPNYKMYIRVHGHMGLSTILYCIPTK